MSVDVNVTIRNKDGKTAYELAKNPQCAALLQRAGRPHANLYDCV